MNAYTMRRGGTEVQVADVPGHGLRVTVTSPSGFLSQRPTECTVGVDVLIGNHRTHRYDVESLAWGPGHDERHVVARLRPVFDGSAATCTIAYVLTLPDQGDGLEESIDVENTSDQEIAIDDLRLVLQVDVADEVLWMAVPFLSHTDRPEALVMNGRSAASPRSEGAILHVGQYGLAVARKPDDLPPRMIEARVDATGRLAVGAVAMDEPGAGGIAVRPRETVSLGTTAFLPYQGPMEQGFTEYRAYMARRGLVVPPGYDPPINYCIYYECGEYYQYQTLLDEMDHARALGCTMLYLDQGWETYAGSGLWDTPRLGELDDFVGKARSYGLGVGVLVKLHGRAFCWDAGMTRQDRHGNVLPGDRWGTGNLVGVCPGSMEWKRAKTGRLARLAEAGVAFFSFDFNDYQTEYACGGVGHPHASPMSRWEHVRHVAAQQAMTKAACPGVLIEAHDWASAGEYVYPIYLFRESHDERWGFEYMWKPFDDFTAGRLHNLYYYNLSYETPLYLHMDLTSDNEHGVVFWYLASTIRHLGVGNYVVLDDRQKRACVARMQVYREYRDFFTRGLFAGVGPCVHCHSLPGQGAVVLLFNDSARAATVSAELGCQDLGVHKDSLTVRTVYGESCEAELADTLVLRQHLPPYSVSVMYVGR